MASMQYLKNVKIFLISALICQCSPGKIEKEVLPTQGFLLTQATPFQVVDMIDGALNGILNAAYPGKINLGEIIRSGVDVNNLVDVSSEDLRCSSQGLPWDAVNNNVMLNTHEDYAGKFLYCFMTVNSHDQKTLRGSYRMSQFSLCLIKSNSDSFSWENQSADITININDDCLPELYRILDVYKNLHGKTLSYETTKLNDPYWKYQISLNFPAKSLKGINTSQVIRIATSKDLIGISIQAKKNVERPRPGGLSISWEIETGSIRYEAVVPSIKRHVRFMAQGIGNAPNNTFKSIDILEGIIQTDQEIVTLRGSTEKGLLGITYIGDNNRTLESYTTNQIRCFSASGSCIEGFAPLQITQETDFDFFYTPNLKSDLSKHLEDWLYFPPLNFKLTNFDFIPSFHKTDSEDAY